MGRPVTVKRPEVRGAGRRAIRRKGSRLARAQQSQVSTPIPDQEMSLVDVADAPGLVAP